MEYVFYFAIAAIVGMSAKMAKSAKVAAVGVCLKMANSPVTPSVPCTDNNTAVCV